MTGAGLDSETRDMILDTLRKYAERKLTTDYLLQLDHDDRFPEEVLKELYDPMQLGLHLLFIPEEFNGLGGGAYDIYRVSELMAAIDLALPRVSWRRSSAPTPFASAAHRSRKRTGWAASPMKRC